MGLDVYAGALSRYYLREWETEVEEMLRQNPTFSKNGVVLPSEDLRVVEVKAATPVFEHLEWPAAVAALESWRDGLAAALENSSVDWSEAEDTPYLTRKITWEGFTALTLWAAYEEHPDLPRPAALPDSAGEDPALERSCVDLSASRYPQLLGGNEIWLPGDDNRTFRAADVCGEKKDIGFLAELVNELRELNHRTWGADSETIRRWSLGPPEDRAALEANARFGFAILWLMGATAYHHRFPMLLDY